LCDVVATKERRLVLRLSLAIATQQVLALTFSICLTGVLSWSNFRSEHHPYTKSRIDQILCVCMCNYTSQTTEPICIKITSI